jgi:hypothetical protein
MSKKISIVDLPETGVVTKCGSESNQIQSPSKICVNLTNHETTQNSGFCFLNGISCGVQYQNNDCGHTGKAPNFIAPSPLNFGNDFIGVTETKMETLILYGDSISSSGFVITGHNAGDFSIVSTSVGSLVNGVITESVTIGFDPLSLGCQSAELKITDNHGISHDVQLTGTGIAGYSFSPSSAVLNFGNELENTTSASKTVTIIDHGEIATVADLTPLGANPADFHVVSVSAAVNGMQTATIDFDPLALGAASAKLVAADGSMVALSGTGIAGYSFSPSSAVLNFGNELEGTTSAFKTVTIIDHGETVTAADLIPSGANPADFHILSVTAAVNGIQTATIDFNPLALGAASAGLTATDGSTVSLLGIGTPGYSFSPSSAALNFGNELEGTTSPSQTVTIIDHGETVTAADLIPSGSNPADFHVLSVSAAVNGMQTATIDFDPLALGTASAELVATDGSTVALSGMGIGGFTAPTPLNFGSEPVHMIETKPETITLYGDSIPTGGLVLSGTNAGDFSIGSISVGTPVNGMATETVNLSFDPLIANVKETANLTITDIHGNTQTVALTGTGTGHSSPLPSNMDFGGEQIGVQATQTQTVTLYGETLPAGDFTFSGANGGDFSVVKTAPGAPVNGVPTEIVTFGFTPTHEGAESANLTVKDSAGNSQTVSVTGTGLLPIVNAEDYETDINLHLPTGAQLTSVSETSGNLVGIPTTVDGLTFTPTELAGDPTTLYTLPGYSADGGIIAVSPNGEINDTPFSTTFYLINSSTIFNDEGPILPNDKFTYTYTNNGETGQKTIYVSNVPDESLHATVNDNTTSSNLVAQGDNITITLASEQDEMQNITVPSQTLDGELLTSQVVSPGVFSITISKYMPGDTFTATNSFEASHTSLYTVPVEVQFGNGVNDPTTLLSGNGKDQILIGGLDPNGTSILNENGTSVESSSSTSANLGEGGKGNLIGMVGTNEFIVEDNSIASVQGATNGYNTLYWNSANDLNISSMRSIGIVFTNLDKIDLGSSSTIGTFSDVANGTSKEVAIGYSDLLAITHQAGTDANALYITGNVGAHPDIVSLENVMGNMAAGGVLPNGWIESTGAPTLVNGITYDHYTSTHNSITENLYAEHGLRVI